MKKIQTATYLLLAGFFAISSAQAHDPSEHAMKKEKPKCEAMKNMDHSKIDMKDPVMMAMMKKCMSEGSAEDHHTEDAVKTPRDNSEKKQVDQHGNGHSH
jgi:L-serine deaminase